MLFFVLPVDSTPVYASTQVNGPVVQALWSCLSLDSGLISLDESSAQLPLAYLSILRG